MAEPTAFKDIHWNELLIGAGASLFVGLIRLLMLIRSAKKVRIVDILLEPLMAVLAGVLTWFVAEVSQVPDMLQVVLTSLGAWGGPRTMQALERKYLPKEPSDEPAK
jgi:glycopeptide antibiotics resistance protein